MCFSCIYFPTRLLAALFKDCHSGSFAFMSPYPEHASLSNLCLAHDIHQSFLWSSFPPVWLFIFIPSHIFYINQLIKVLLSPFQHSSYVSAFPSLFLITLHILNLCLQPITTSPFLLPQRPVSHTTQYKRFPLLPLTLIDAPPSPIYSCVVYSSPQLTPPSIELSRWYRK